MNGDNVALTPADAGRTGPRLKRIFALGAAGHLDHWLVAGPQAIAVTNLGDYDTEHPRPGILRDYHESALPVKERPAEGERLTVEDRHGTATFPWMMRHCGADHFVDFTTFGFTCHYLRTWAYAGLRVPGALPAARMILTANGPADVWVNGRHVQRYVAFNYQIPRSVEFAADLNAGDNDIVVAFEVIAIRECPYAFALQIPSAAVGGAIHLPTTIDVPDRDQIEALLAAAGIDRSVFHGDEPVIVRWPEGVAGRATFRLRVESAIPEGLGRLEPDRKAHVETRVEAQAGAEINLGPASSLPNGRLVILLTAESPGVRKILFIVAKGDFATEPYGTPASRTVEALETAATQASLYGEIAKMALGRWDALSEKPWEEPFDRLQNRGDCSDFALLGMLGALHRFGGNPRFPEDLRARITRAALDFRYWMDEPGSDAMCFHTENHQILFHACEVVAGQLWPDDIFSNAGQTGAWHRQKGGQLALGWLRRRAAEGFQEWDSNVYFEIDVVALAHLADLADDPEVAAMAAIVLDKLLLSLAMNSFRGVFGSTHGRVYSDLIKGGRLELTSGLSRMLWGTGVFNDSIIGTVSLACASRYQLPPAIHDIAVGVEENLWSRERNGGRFLPEFDCRDGEWEVNKVTCKTRDYMLCSAQDFQPGKPGNQTHIWQATFGPDAVAFSTHPVCLAEDGYHRPNFWHGNGVLPRVAQRRDFLVALYELPADDWMGFTHAYFPVVHFDEWILRDGWAFSRKAAGYLAIHASCGLQPVATACGAMEELRSPGRRNVWLCQMGCASQDGAFADFQKAILAAPVGTDGTEVRTRTIRGEEISFSWHGPLRVNGQEERITGFPPYDNNFCRSELNATNVRIQSPGHWLEWDLKQGRRTMGVVNS